MRILVTGSAGQVCSHICDALLEQRHHVYGLDSRLSGVDNTPKGVEDIRTDLRTIHALPVVDAVVHGASYAELAGNWSATAERIKLFEHNEHATRNLLEVLNPCPVIYLSSASVYGSQCAEHHRPLTEQARLSIESPYAASKAASELYIQAWTHHWRKPWYVLRLCNQMGSRTHRGLVPDFVRMARGGHIRARDNGSQRRSWINVKDTAQWVTRIVSRIEMSDPLPSGIHNVADPHALWSWRDLVRIMAFDGRVSHEPVTAGADGDPVDIRLDPSKLVNATNYRPTHGVEQAFRDALEHLGWTSA